MLSAWRFGSRRYSSRTLGLIIIIIFFNLIPIYERQALGDVILRLIVMGALAFPIAVRL